MNKHRINTTISAKHWEILKKHTENFETQQKVLEAALERLENGSKQNPALSPEEHLWMRACKELRSNLSVIHKELLKELLRFGFERICKMATERNFTELHIVLFCQKPLKECSLKEIVEGIVYTFRIVNLFEKIDYEDNGNCYLLNVVHTLGMGSLDVSMCFKFEFEKLFEICGVKTESNIYENGIFMKIYKNSIHGSVSVT